MQFQVTAIEFDFTDDIGDDDTLDDYLTDDEKQGFVNQTMTTIWDADDEEDLIDEITSATGFCIKSIDYRHYLK